MTDHKFKVGDRVQWLGFVQKNRGEPDRPIGALGTVQSIGFYADVIYINWDDSKDGLSTWTVNVAPAPVESPAPTGDPELRERMLELATKTLGFSETYQTIIETAAGFEAYVLGGAK